MKMTVLRLLFLGALIQGSSAFAFSESINVNLKGGNGTASILSVGGFSGLVMVNNARWNEIDPSKDTVSLSSAKDSAGTATPLALTMTTGGRWGYSRTAYDAMMKGYSDGPCTITLTGIPYAQYDLYLYFNSDLDASNTWSPVKIGETYYTYAAGATGGAAVTEIGGYPATDTSNWGKNAQDEMTLGVNCMLITGLTQSDLEVYVAHNRNGAVNNKLGNISGFQIVDPTALEPSLRRTLTANATWHEDVWVTESGMTNQPWRDGVPAYVTVPAGITLTLTQPVAAEKVIASGTGTLASSAPANTLTPAEGLLIASTAAQTFTVTAALSAPEGGDFLLFANGEFGGGNGGMTLFQPIALNASALRIRSGVVRVFGLLTHDAALILDGGGLVDDNRNTIFTQELQIGLSNSGYRTYGTTSTAQLAGIIRNETGNATAGSFEHNDGGTLTVTGDISGYTGALSNKAGTLVLTPQTITSANNLLTCAGAVIAFNVPEGETATYSGNINGSDYFRKTGPGTLTLPGTYTAGGTLDVGGGTLILGPSAQWYTGAWYKGEARIQVSGGGALVFQRDWNYGVALGNMGNNAQCIRLNNGTLRFEASTTSSRAFCFNTGGATIEVAEGVTFVKTAGTVGDENLTFNREDNATLTFAGAGTGIFNDTIPQTVNNVSRGTTNMAVKVTGSDWSLNGTYTYVQGTTVEAGGVLRGTGTFRASPVTVRGTIATGATIDTLVLEAGSTIRVDEGRILIVDTAITVGGAIGVTLPQAPASVEAIAFATLPEGVTIDPYAFTVSGFATAGNYAVFQDGRTLSVALKRGTVISLY